MAWFRGEIPPNAKRFPAAGGECYIYEPSTGFGQIELGRFSYIGENSYIAARSPVRIGSFCAIAANFHCATHGQPVENILANYPLAEMLGVPVLGGSICPSFDEPVGNDVREINIGHDVWIGHDVFVTGHSTIGDGCIVGAKSVVDGNLLPYGVYGGNPARLIRMRFPETVVNRLLETRWWDWPIEQILENGAFFSTDIARFDGDWETLIQRSGHAA